MRKLIMKADNMINMKADYIHRGMYFIDYVIIKSEQS